jgi:hypothetical protein
MAAVAAPKPEGGLEQFGTDPLLTMACVALIVVSISWIVLSPAIYRNLRRAAEQAELKIDSVRAPRDIWKTPPE